MQTMRRSFSLRICLWHLVDHKNIVENNYCQQKVCRKAGGRSNNQQLYNYQLISGLTEFYLAFSC